MTSQAARRVLIGMEVEAYSIGIDDYSIGRRLSRPRPGLSESGERFTRDASIGSEYNSRPFATVREALFLMKSGLRKYLRGFYRGRAPADARRVPLLVGCWTDRNAGAHMHLSVAGRRLDLREAKSLAFALHDHIPFFIAIGANSPVWHKQLTARASIRVLRGSRTYFTPLRRGALTTRSTAELVYSRGRKTKPPTLELRVLDSNIPEFLVAVLTLVKAAAMGWLRGRPAANRVPYEAYRRARVDAGFRGMRARLPWKGELLSVAEYLDRYLWTYREELELMDVPEEIYETLRLIKRGYNGSRLLHDAVSVARAEHPQTWQRRFARRYAAALGRLLSGDTLEHFARELKVELPSTENVWLGRRNASVDE
jgi:hypothetical protein